MRLWVGVAGAGEYELPLRGINTQTSLLVDSQHPTYLLDIKRAAPFLYI
jgi:hypothetical protein